MLFSLFSIFFLQFANRGVFQETDSNLNLTLNSELINPVMGSFEFSVQDYYSGAYTYHPVDPLAISPSWNARMMLTSLGGQSNLLSTCQQRPCFHGTYMANTVRLRSSKYHYHYIK